MSNFSLSYKLPLIFKCKTWSETDGLKAFIYLITGILEVFFSFFSNRVTSALRISLQVDANFKLVHD